MWVTTEHIFKFQNNLSAFAYISKMFMKLNLRRILDYKLRVFCTKTCRKLIFWSIALFKFYALTKLRTFIFKVQDILIMMVKLLPTLFSIWDVLDHRRYDPSVQRNLCEIWDAFILSGCTMR